MLLVCMSETLFLSLCLSVSLSTRALMEVEIQRGKKREEREKRRGNDKAKDAEEAEEATTYLDLVALACAACRVQQAALRPVQDAHVEPCVGAQVPVARLAPERKVVRATHARGG